MNALGLPRRPEQDEPGADGVFEIGPLWDRVWARRKRIAAMVAAATVLAVVAAMLMPPWFRSSATLLPPSEEDSGIGLGSIMRGVAIPGFRIPGQTISGDVFVTVLRSRRLSEAIVTRFDLMKRYGKKRMEDAVKDLRSNSRFRLSSVGTIEMYVDDKDPARAQSMLNAYIEELDKFNREVRSTKGRRSRLFLETRLTETRRDLAIAEERLATYQAANKTVAVSPELSSAIETAAQLFAQRTALQVRLGVIRGYTRGGSDEENQVLAQLAQLDRQLARLPSTGLEVARLLREAKTQETLYVLLTAQYEEARLNEARDVATVDVLDPPSRPERKVRPKRVVLVGSAFLLALIAGVVMALLEGDRRKLLRTPDVRS